MKCAKVAGRFWCRNGAGWQLCDDSGTFWCKVVAEAVVLALCQIVGKIDLVSYLNGKGCEMFIYC